MIVSGSISLLALALIVLLAASLLVRTTRPVFGLLPVERYCMQPNWQLGMSIALPNCVERVRRKGSVGEARYDEQGLRRSFGDPRGTRVLMMGSSHIAGFGLSDEERTPLAALVANAQRDFPRFYWINGSFNGYSTTHLALVLPRLLEKFHPRLVIVNTLSGPRAMIDAVLADGLAFGPTGYPVRLTALSEPSRAFWELWKRSGAFRWLFLTRYRIQRAFRELFGRLALARTLSQLSEAVRVEALLEPSVRLLKQMQAKTEASGACFLVLLDGQAANDGLVLRDFMVEPLARLVDAWTPPYGASASQIRDALLRAGIPFREMSAEFANGLTAPMLLEDNYHWNEAGAEHFAKYAYPALKGTLAKMPACPGSREPQN